jgi:hypothetical protein
VFGRPLGNLTFLNLRHFLSWTGILTFVLWKEHLLLVLKKGTYLDFEGTKCGMNISQFCYSKEFLRLLFLCPLLIGALDIGGFI